MFLVQSLVNELWVASQRHQEEWIACERCDQLATPTSPTRVIDLKRRRVIRYHGGTRETSARKLIGIEVLGSPTPPLEGWNKYGYSDLVKKDGTRKPNFNGEKTKMSEKDTNPETTNSTPPKTIEVIPVATSNSIPDENEDRLQKLQMGTPPAPPAVEELLGDTEDEEEEEEEEPIDKVWSPLWSGNPRVALLFSGGIFSTATMLNLVKIGYIVHPFFIVDTNGDGRDDRELSIARGIVRIAKSKYSLIQGLQILETRITKQTADRKRRKFIELLTKNLVGSGFNAIAYGKHSVEDKEDTDIMSLQEMTPLQIISPDVLEFGQLEDMLTLLDEGTTDKCAGANKKMIYMSTSCEDPGSRECGDCVFCLVRFGLLTRIWGEDSTRYMKGSKVRKMRKKLKDLYAAAPNGIPDPAEIAALFATKKKKMTAEDEE